MSNLSTEAYVIIFVAVLVTFCTVSSILVYTGTIGGCVQNPCKDNGQDDDITSTNIESSNGTVSVTKPNDTTFDLSIPPRIVLESKDNSVMIAPVPGTETSVLDLSVDKLVNNSGPSGLNANQELLNTNNNTLRRILSADGTVVPSLGTNGNIELNAPVAYDAVVDIVANVDDMYVYATIGDAINDGKRNIFVKTNTVESDNWVLYSNVTTILTYAVNNVSTVFDASGVVISGGITSSLEVRGNSQTTWVVDLTNGRMVFNVPVVMRGLEVDFNGSNADLVGLEFISTLVMQDVIVNGTAAFPNYVLVQQNVRISDCVFDYYGLSVGDGTSGPSISVRVDRSSMHSLSTYATDTISSIHLVDSSFGQSSQSAPCLELSSTKVESGIIIRGCAFHGQVNEAKILVPIDFPVTLRDCTFDVNMLLLFGDTLAAGDELSLVIDNVRFINGTNVLIQEFDVETVTIGTTTAYMSLNVSGCVFSGQLLASGTTASSIAPMTYRNVNITSSTFENLLIFGGATNTNPSLENVTISNCSLYSLLQVFAVNTTAVTISDVQMENNNEIIVGSNTYPLTTFDNWRLDRVNVKVGNVRVVSDSISNFSMTSCVVVGDVILGINIVPINQIETFKMNSCTILGSVSIWTDKLHDSSLTNSKCNGFTVGAETQLATSILDCKFVNFGTDVGGFTIWSQSVIRLALIGCSNTSGGNILFNPNGTAMTLLSDTVISGNTVDGNIGIQFNVSNNTTSCTKCVISGNIVWNGTIARVFAQEATQANQVIGNVVASTIDSFPGDTFIAS
jgi:hypothetical protein